MAHRIFCSNDHHFEIFVFVLTILVDGVLCYYSNSSICAPQTCGNGAKIEYPFWISGRQDSYCGSPRFNVTCKNKNPVLKISGDDYVIRDIVYADNSVLLSQAELYDVGNRCPTPQHNFCVERTPFRYGPETVDLYFLYNCTLPYDRETFPLDCASNSSRHAFAVFHPQFLEHWNYSARSCQAPVNAPVTAEAVESLVDMNYTQVLKKGFALQWDEGHCRNCRRSGGRCGSNSTEFVCFCNDHISLKTCYKGKIFEITMKQGNHCSTSPISQMIPLFSLVPPIYLD